MRFSDHYNITKSEKEDWFDTTLVVDTKLFIDPFLIYTQEEDVFEGSHEEVIRFFNDVYVLIAKSGGDNQDSNWKKANRLLMFPEVDELCLGYANQGTGGAGSGSGFSKVIAEAIWEAIEAGTKEISHFEEVGIFRIGIGADRISDITANILKHRFARFTEIICERHNISTEDVKVVPGKYNFEYQRWLPFNSKLPLNPYNNKPILLCPDKFLKDLPTISADNFWSYCFDNENETLRNDYGWDVSRNVDKETIIEFAQNHPKLKTDFLEYVEEIEPEPYDFEKDRRGVFAYYEATNQYVNNNPLQLTFATERQFIKFINKILEVFRNYIENNEGWGLLWNDNGMPRSEEAAQRLFQGIVMHYCRASNVDISKEVNIGRGPVDFKVSQGYQYRSLLELKLAKNTKFWRGLERQLPKYQEAEDIKIGYFVVIMYTENDYKRMNDIQERVKKVNAETGYKISIFSIDAARNPPSASKL